MIIRTENSRVTFYLLIEDSEVEGIRINSELPEKEENGMIAELYYTPEFGLYYEYKEKPIIIPETSQDIQPTLEERVTIEQQVAELQNQLDELRLKL